MAWNDPQWGKKNDGPPDLDKMWRSFNSKLNKLLGGKLHPLKPVITPRTLLIALGVALAVWLASGLYIVETGERGIVLRFGRYVATSQPGPGWHLPYPIESVEVLNIEQVRTAEIGYRDNIRNKVLKESLMLTNDTNIVDIQFAVQYTIKDPQDYLFNNRSPDDAVRQVAESVMNQLIGQSTMDYVLYQGRAGLADRATKDIQRLLDTYGTGISVNTVTLQNIQPPQEVRAAFDDAVKAGQDADRLKSDAQAYTNDITPKARGVAAGLQEEAASYQQSVITNAQGQADRFNQILAQYNKAPAVTRDRLYIDMMQHVLTHTTKILVDSSKGSSPIIYLPLDKLMQQTVASPSATAARPPASNIAVPIAPVAPNTDQKPETPASATTKPDGSATVEDTPSVRDAMRSRDREDRP